MKRVVIIGAGISGLLAIKSCKESDILDIVCYEKCDSIAGLWRYTEEDNGMLTVMKTTVMNTSKEMSAISDFPPDESLPIYLSHKNVVEYLEKYCENFDLKKHINFGKEVVAVIPNTAGNKQWSIFVRDVKQKNEYTENADIVMICSGYHSTPNLPHILGMDSFSGEVIHSLNYKKADAFTNKKVLVVGSGNTAVDIATDLCTVTDKVYLSTRRGFWTLSRYGSNGLPIDMILQKRIYHEFKKIIPNSLSSWFLNFYTSFDHETFGIKPNYNLLAKLPPTFNEYLCSKIASGCLEIFGEIERVNGSKVFFKNEDNEHHFDCIILATGYGISYPYLSKTCELFANGEMTAGKDHAYDNFYCHLYENMFCPYLQKPESLIFIGLVQSYGSLFALIEMQCRWAAALIAETCEPLPSKDEMCVQIERRKRHNLKHYAYTETNQIYLSVDWLAYCDNIALKLKCKPNFLRMLFKEPKLFWYCCVKSLLPYQYRIEGPNNWIHAKAAIFTAETRIFNFLNAKRFFKKTEN
ncbi:dimethylaniline monooxygenase [N-oxide-forming] 5-like protein [Dinothrombium tinctorium]|uniref:Flavin-containing monooxygenase n=1 Tax=Dinothrombium tinctorium TaxID=1965070 RepID=A0A443R699_9ACAR|nr:dimethylaniline monooxygenase [N-oxide-forming] 5-like protein [Dinothrombium tinctorium]